MQTEFEVKFCNINIDEIRERLENAGAVLIKPMQLMRRYVFDYDDRRLQVHNSYIRLRDEGDKITLTFKHFSQADKVGGAHEIETVVDSFDKTRDIFRAIGIMDTSYQESRREVWELDGGEVMIDEWPWLKPYIEVEAKDAASVRTMAEKLQLDWRDKHVGDVLVAYRLQYDIPHQTFSKNIIRFDDPRPDWMVPKASATNTGQ